MKKILHLIAFAAVMVSCKTEKNSKVKDMLKSVELFKEASSLMIKGLAAEMKSSDSSKIYYEQSLRIFQEAHNYDTANIQLAIYLPDLYYKLGKQDSADFWMKRLPVDSIALSNKHNPTSLLDTNLRK